MSVFSLEVADIKPELTDDEAMNLAISTLDIFDGGWCSILTGIKRTFNNESDEIIELVKKVEKLRNLCGPINNNRVSEWQRQYYEFEDSLKRGENDG